MNYDAELNLRVRRILWIRDMTVRLRLICRTSTTRKQDKRSREVPLQTLMCLGFVLTPIFACQR